VESICSEECHITNATECVTTIDEEIEYIKNMYACSAYNHGDIPDCSSSNSMTPGNSQKKNSWSFNFGRFAKISSNWDLTSSSSSSKDEIVKDAVNLWFSKHGKSVPMYGVSYDCPPLWPGYWHMNVTADDIEAMNTTVIEEGNSTEIVIENSCTPTFEWGILCKYDPFNL
jgi:hypothetical protein